MSHKLTSSITPYMERTGMSAGDVVSQLRAGVEEKTGLTISAGIAPNKMLAKVSIDGPFTSDRRYARTRTNRMDNSRWNSRGLPSLVSCEICQSEKCRVSDGSRNVASKVWALR